ncbi:enhancer of mRNA-decapping protein 4 [Parasteatoda tepidariorum]|uniref:enhancer of mRNA-decapping protein 4 n=1 Tax=Parasteatoda tepidariorum TaxID=114398 RepID=UPI00077FC8BB
MNGHSGIDTFEATEHLKNILNVGKNDFDSGRMKTSNGAMETANELHDGQYQKIEIPSNKDSFHVAVYGNEVEILSSCLETGCASSQVMVENLVDYGWEEKYYHGKLVNVHLSGLYLAYVLKPATNKPGLVRVVKTRPQLRLLIKDYKSEVKDIAFAHTTSQVILGSVDAMGELLVHKITEEGSALLCNLVIRIVRSEDWVFSEYNRIIWCLFIPDDTDNSEEDTAADDVSSLLVVTHNEKAEIWDIDTVIKKYGHGNLKQEEVKCGVQVIKDHKEPIATATFSPDGTAIAIASTDGVVNFFQVNIPEQDESPRCLHKWIPHNNKPLSSLYFLDNHKNHKPDVQFWKFAVTGAENNTELKLWSCESWNCLQTIRIRPNSEDVIEPVLKAEMDHSSKFLFLSDIKRRAVLIMYIMQDPVSGSAMICSLSEYRVSLPILSLAISSISYTKSQSFSEDKNSDDEGDIEQAGDELNNADESLKYILKLFWIQTKALQSSKIYYQPKMNSPLMSAESISSLSQDSYVYKDGLSDISVDLNTSSRSRKDDISLQKNLCIDDLSITSPPAATSLPSHISTYSNCSEVLLTPNDFTSPSHTNLSAPDSFTHPEDVSTKCEGIEVVEASSLVRRKSSQHSATSSPSREVAEILAPIKILNLDEIPSDSSSVKHEENGLEDFNLSEAAGISRNQEYHMKDWPQAPDHTKSYRISAMNMNDNELLGPTHFQAESRETSDISLDMSSKLLKFNHNLDEMTQKIGAFTNIMHDQRCDIQNLQKEIKLLRQNQMLSQQSLDETVITSKLEGVVSQTLLPHYSRLENLVLKKADEERRRTERELIKISNDMSSSLGNRLESTLKQELSANIVPQINRVLDTVSQKMQLDFNQKLSATDTSLRENFAKHLKSKPFMDSIAQAASTSLQGVVQVACKEVFLNNVVPSFEKASQHLFQQLNDVFYKGTLEYLQSFERSNQQSSTTLETVASSVKDEMKKLVVDAQQNLHAQITKSETLNTNIVKQHEALLASVRQIVQEETRKMLREQQNAVLNSRSTTPVPLADPQLQKQQLRKLVMQGNLNEAFQEALTAMDVQLVLYLCESVNVEQVFGPTPCPLQQHVMLSLVNQLSADLNVKTEIKVRYIEEVIPCLDNDNAITRDHIRTVLENLQHRISTFLSRNPNHKLSRCLRRINMAINSLIK